MDNLLAISRHHAEICYEPYGSQARFTITDKSQGGVMINDVVIIPGQKYILFNGDKISVRYPKRFDSDTEIGIVFTFTVLDFAAPKFLTTSNSNKKHRKSQKISDPHNCLLIPIH